MIRFVAVIPFLFMPFINLGQSDQNKALVLSEIMKGNEFIGYQPENIQWSMDGKQIIFDWNPENAPASSQYSYSLSSKTTEKLTPAFFNSNALTSSHKQFDIEVFTHGGNLYKYNRKTEDVTPILVTNTPCRNLQRHNGQNIVYFQQGDGLFRYDLNKGTILQLLKFSKSSEPKEKIPDHLEEQELHNFRYLRDKKEKTEFIEEYEEQFLPDIPVVYTNNLSYSNIQVTPDGKYVFYRLDDYPKTEQTEVPHYINENGQTSVVKARAKVSGEDPDHKLYYFSLCDESSAEIDLSRLNDLKKKPEYFKEYGDDQSEYQKDRNKIMHRLLFNDRMDIAVADIRSYDNKDRWIVSIDLKTFAVREVEHQHDEAWIGGPGISSWNMVSGTLGWLNNETIYFQSEETGYSHLYTLNLSSGKKTPLTSGNWEVHEVVLSNTKKKFYITANKIHPGNREFYHLELASKKLIPVFTSTGAYEVTISPDETQLAVRYSNSNTPWELYIAPNKPSADLKQITTSTTKEFNKYTWRKPDVITIKASDGTDVYARLYSPEEEDKNKAAVIFVHGAGYLQNAHNFWSGYYREYMFHNLLTDLGYTVLDIDYRASKGYGRDHRTAIYRHMGGKDLSDQLDGKQFLIDSLGIDPDRVGIYGGSYGGFITLMALLTAPGEFKCGAALRSVTDWNHYNHEYTSNILNYPTTDTLAYYRSSPFNFADNLEDRLIMLHGMVDDNVQFQDVVRLSQKFIELGKTNWELSVFPVEAHGFVRSDAWTDEYRRILEMLNEELLRP